MCGVFQWEVADSFKGKEAAYFSGSKECAAFFRGKETVRLVAVSSMTKAVEHALLSP